VGEVLAEGDIVVQFGTRELTSPGGAFLGDEALAETAIRDLALPADLSMAALAIRDLTMLRQLGALHLYRVAQAGVSAAGSCSVPDPPSGPLSSPQLNQRPVRGPLRGGRVLPDHGAS
jgi:hypothetical protein